MDDLVVRPDLTIPAAELELSAARSGGPGGQHVNKTSSKIIVRFDIRASAALTPEQKGRLLARIPPRWLTKDGVVVIDAEEERDQARNRQRALEKLAEALRMGLVRPKTRRQTKPTRSSKARTREDKQAKKRIKEGRRHRSDD